MKINNKNKKLHIVEEKLYLGEEQFRIISGAIHYFRVVPEYWEDRLIKLKACGFNTVETYVPWNLHEPKEGTYNFDGMADIEKFIAIAQKLGLYVIVRISPYICSEWEFGGLPSWLLKYSDMRLRCNDGLFLEKIDRYFDAIIPRIIPYLSTNGGPVIAMQVENEYGSYGNDNEYMNYIKDAMQKRGVDVLLFTSDGPTDYMFQGGMIEGVWGTANFGSRVDEAIEKLQQFQPNKPMMCAEFWNGWFDHWNGEHHSRDVRDVAAVFDEMLSKGMSVNFYMFHGGTNFGFYNGANHEDGKYKPVVTSYDSDALLNEYGEITPKYLAVRETLSKYQSLDEFEAFEPVKRINYGQVKLDQVCDLNCCLEDISYKTISSYTVTMEQLNQDYGFIMYTTYIKAPREEGKLYIQDVRDRALVFLDDNYIGVIERWDNKQFIQLSNIQAGAKLSILVENMGRVNYGPYLCDPKGITQGVRIDNQFLFDWEIYSIPLDDLSQIKFEKNSHLRQPCFHKGSFYVEDRGDCFLNFSGWEKGVAFINGFNLGRYWSVGPQKTLYIPAPILKEKQINEIILFELHGSNTDIVSIQDTHVL